MMCFTKYIGKPFKKLAEVGVYAIKSLNADTISIRDAYKKWTLLITGAVVLWRCNADSSSQLGVQEGEGTTVATAKPCPIKQATDQQQVVLAPEDTCTCQGEEAFWDGCWPTVLRWHSDYVCIEKGVFKGCRAKWDAQRGGWHVWHPEAKYPPLKAYEATKAGVKPQRYEAVVMDTVDDFQPASFKKIFSYQVGHRCVSATDTLIEAKLAAGYHAFVRWEALFNHELPPTPTARILATMLCYGVTGYVQPVLLCADAYITLYHPSVKDCLPLAQKNGNILLTGLLYGYRLTDVLAFCIHGDEAMRQAVLEKLYPNRTFDAAAAETELAADPKEVARIIQALGADFLAVKEALGPYYRYIVDENTLPRHAAFH